MSLHAQRMAHRAASHRTHAWACMLTVATAQSWHNHGDKHGPVTHARLDAAWGVAVCKIISSFVRVCRVGEWFGCVRSSLLLAVGTCAVLSFGALPGLSFFLRVTHASHGKKQCGANDTKQKAITTFGQSLSLQLLWNWVRQAAKRGCNQQRHMYTRQQQ